MYFSQHMKTRAFLDWIAATATFPARGEADCASWGYEITHLPEREWTRSSPRHGYKWAMSHALGFEVMASPSLMGTHFICPGHALRGGQFVQSTAQGILHALDTHGAKLTRLDVAVDALQSGLEIDDLAASIELGTHVSTSRTWNYVIAPNGGQTLYIGARSSERFVRIYNKTAELGADANRPDEADWKRIELEAKAVAARAYGKMLLAGINVERVANDAITAVIDFPDNAQWRAIFAATSQLVAHSHRKLHNRERWLLGVVAKSLAEQMQLDPTFKERFWRMVRSFLDGVN